MSWQKLLWGRQRSSFVRLMMTVLVVVLAGCISSTSTDLSAPAPSNSIPSPAASSQSSTNADKVAQPDPPEPRLSQEGSSPQTTTTSDLWNLLRQGRGYTVMLRHAFAPGTGDPANFRVEDCTTQRNLSEVGRQQAVEIGAAFRQQQIPVSRVFSSQWCRCLETARLMDLGEVEPLPAINSFFQDRSTEPQQTAQVRQLILDQRDQTGVTILVTHQVNITAISGIVPASGGMVVLRANGDDVEFVGEIPPLP